MKLNQSLFLLCAISAFAGLQGSSASGETTIVNPGDVVDVEETVAGPIKSYVAHLTDGTHVVAHDYGKGGKKCTYVHPMTGEHGKCDGSNFDILRTIFKQRQQEQKK